MAKQTIKTPAAAVADIDDGRLDYEITDMAPPRVAGQRLQPGQTSIRLTEDQARAEVLAGHIRPMASRPAPPAADDGTA